MQTLALPVHEPPHVANAAPDAGVAVSVTVEPTGRLVLHAVALFPQLTPGPVTVPRPLTVTDSGNVGDEPPVNEAVTDRAAVIESVQLEPDPLQAPPQPANVAPEPGDANRVTVEFRARFALQADAPLPQVMPGPLTLPGPLTETVSGTVALPVPPENVAVTVFAAFIRIVQVVDVPPHGPVQPVNVEPVAGTALSVTDLFGAKLAEQIVAPLPQLIAPLSPLTLPFPWTLTVSCISGEKVAVTLREELMRIVQVRAVPPQAPAQPAKVEPVAGSAVSVTVSSTGTLAVQRLPFWPQLIAPSSPVIVPLPSPETFTLSWTTGANVAVTDLASFMRTLHVVAWPEQAPPHSLKM